MSLWRNGVRNLPARVMRFSSFVATSYYLRKINAVRVFTLSMSKRPNLLLIRVDPYQILNLTIFHTRMSHFRICSLSTTAWMESFHMSAPNSSYCFMPWTSFLRHTKSLRRRISRKSTIVFCGEHAFQWCSTKSSAPMSCICRTRPSIAMRPMSKNSENVSKNSTSKKKMTSCRQWMIPKNSQRKSRRSWMRQKGIYHWSLANIPIL